MAWEDFSGIRPCVGSEYSIRPGGYENDGAALIPTLCFSHDEVQLGCGYIKPCEGVVFLLGPAVIRTTARL